MQFLTLEECKAWRQEHARRHEWKRRVSCWRAVDRFDWFADQVIEVASPFERAIIIVEPVCVFEPRALLELRTRHGETRSIYDAPGHVADTHAEFKELLVAMLLGILEIRVLFSPPRCAIFSDNDELTTFFSVSSGKVADLRERLVKGKIRMADDFQPRQIP
jgi:hypothetical protein